MSKLLLFLLLVTGCGSYSPYPCQPAWQLHSACECALCYRTAHLYYPAPYPCGCLSLELIRDQCGTRMYVNLLLVPICCKDPCEPHAAIVVAIDEIDYIMPVTVMKGGQRLLLEEDDMNRIVEALLSEHCINIRIGMYCQDIYPGEFYECYNAMLNCSL